MHIAEGLTLFVILSIVTEGITGVLKRPLPEKLGPIEAPLVLAIVVGVAVALVTRFDIFSQLGLEVYMPEAAWILTGCGLGGGSKGAHEIISKIRASRDDKQTPPEPIEVVHKTEI